METLILSGQIIDLILVLVAFEAFVLLGWRVWRGGPSLASLAGNLAAGAALMLAVRVALRGADWMILAGCLAVALVAHMIDLLFRFRESRAVQLAASSIGPAPEHRAERTRSWRGTHLE